ncbi:MAG: hypothetical protein H0V17_12475 [Deltaproteobacteria bacterium]|nr:hypothetical protein [Deltaproteobacteria bacterium]
MNVNGTGGGRKGPKRSRRGTKVTVDELVAKSHTVFDRVTPLLERAAAKIRARFTSK